MMIYIELFANKYSTLGFDEVFFNTLALENNLLHIEPEELDTIKYNDTYYLNSIKKENLYHPVKEINKYNIFLQNLDITFYKKLEIDIR